MALAGCVIGIVATSDAPASLANNEQRPSFTHLLLSVENPLISFITGFFAYLLYALAYGSPIRVTRFAYFNYLADAFLHGQLFLRLPPPHTHDLVFYHNQYGLYWPPMPAIILMPFVALFGVNFSDVLFNIVVAAINVALVALLLRVANEKGLVTLDRDRRALLVVFFALGTVHTTLASDGLVWHTSQLVSFSFMCLAYILTLSKEGKLAVAGVGTLIALSMLTRNHLLFIGIWPAWFILSRVWGQWRKVAGYIAIGLLPVLILGCLYLAYNYARFGNILETGYSYHNMAADFRADYQQYGSFSLHYLPINFYYQYVYYPLPFSPETSMGGSLFLLSPVWLLAVWTIFKEIRNLNVLMLLATIMVVNIPILLLFGTGWVQFGPRYTLDFTAPLLMLTARSARDIPRPALIALIAVSILHYLLGVFYIASP